MNTPHTCPLESQVLSAIGSTMSEPLVRHLESCSSCMEAKGIAEKMRQLASRHIATPPPDPAIIWMMGQLSKPPVRWTREVFTGIAALAASALLAVLMWPAIADYLSGFVPKSAGTVNVFLTSCVVAAAIAGVAAISIRKMTGE